MTERITEAEVSDWFRHAGGKSWPAPLHIDVGDLAELLTQYKNQPTDDENRGGHLDRWEKIRASAVVLSTEVPAILSLARASALQASREKIEGPISGADVKCLEELVALLSALRPIFEANLFRSTDLTPPRVNNRWHGLARLIASQCRAAWERAGIPRVGEGNIESSPVVKFVQLALARMNEAHERGAIVKVLRQWNKSGARRG